MASQQSQNNENHSRVQSTRTAARGASSSTHPSHQHMPVDEQLVRIDSGLYEASNMIEDSRRLLHGYKPGMDALSQKCAAYEHARKEEQQNLADYVRAYNSLHAQHEQTVSSLRDMANKCLSIHQELEETQKDKRILESKIQELEKHLNNKVNPDESSPVKGIQPDWSMASQGITESEHLESRIRELENEKSEMLQEQQKTLMNAAHRINAAEQKIDVLEAANKSTESKRLPSLDSKVKSESGPEDQASDRDSGPATRIRKRKRAAKVEGTQT